MSRNLAFKFTVIFIAVLLSAPVFAQDGSVLKTQKDRMSYAVGVDIGRNIKRQGIGAQTEELVRGIRDVLAGEKLLMGEEDIRTTLNEFQMEMKLKRARTEMTVAEENKRNGEAFLAANRTKEGVVTLPSGLQYKILKLGNGRKPKGADTVEVNYRGILIDGTEFDSSYGRGQPATLKLTGVIKGWTEALQLMSVGSKWQLFIPPELAYGASGHAYGKRVGGRSIGPYETLIFEVELLSVK